MSGRLASRPLPVCAIAFTLPDLTNPTTAEPFEKTNFTWPAMTSVIASPPPRYGM